MDAKEKADELILKFMSEFIMDKGFGQVVADTAKKYSRKAALICVEEMISYNNQLVSEGKVVGKGNLKYLNQVKQELEKR